jgi:hypothetical protein
VEEAVQCLWAVLHGVISLRITSPNEAWVDDLEGFALDTVLHGLIAPDGAAEQAAAGAAAEAR